MVWFASSARATLEGANKVEQAKCSPGSYAAPIQRRRKSSAARTALTILQRFLVLEG